MRKITNILIMLLITCSFVPEGYAKSPKSELKNIKKRYEKIKTLQTQFREVFEWAMTGEKVQREGSLIIGEKNAFRIESDEQLIVSDGNSIYRFNKVSNQVIIETVDKGKDNALPRRMMLKFAEEFSATELTEMMVNNLPGARLDLEPKDSDKVMISNATIWYTSEDNTVNRLKFSDLNGNTTTYFFINPTFNQSVDPNLMAFIPPENAETFDLRH